ncbi:MAG: redoxin domain-containing protein [Deltaproteobacteria bacterium]|nr:redoxin domain-containing protein [Deltaproteobacteria bacterium]MBW2413565.1 redoxin domain-containing protein [Deltaproteobacteria bacterium]
MQDFDAAGVAVYALSYDEADALRDFGVAHGITYTLLSDPDSDVIRSFSILNTLIDPNAHPWYGIPYPGTYVVSAEGAITHKFFDNNLALRAGPEQLLRAAQGQPMLESKPNEAAPEEVQVRVALDGDNLAPMVQKDLVVRFSVPTGRHVYAKPAPQGAAAVEVTLDENERLVQRPVVRPTSEPHALAGTEESFQVHHDVFELRLPLTVNGSAGSDAAAITISGEVSWQCCDDEVCDIPTSQRFELTLPVSEPPAVALGNRRGATLEPNAMAHFQRMSERRRGSD